MYTLTPEYAVRAAQARRESGDLNLCDVLGTSDPRHKDSGIFCLNWNDNKPQLVFDARTGEAIGTLMPVDYELVRRSPGIQQHSKG